MNPLDILSDLVRSFAFALDSVVYSLIPIIYKLFIYLSEINLFSVDSPLGTIVQRIYVFLGIFMLFKVSFSLIQYLIDPNAFSDSSKGFGKLVTNALVTMILLVSVPYIFNFAYNLQSKIVTSNAIGSLITGGDMGKVNVNEEIYDDFGNMTAVGPARISTAQVEEMATDVQFLMYGSFFSINPDTEINGHPNSGEKQEGKKNNCASSPIFGTVSMAQNKPCLQDLAAEFSDPNSNMYSQGAGLTDFFKTQTNEDDKNTVEDNRRFASFGSMLSWRDESGVYVIDYLQFVSAIAGGYVVFLLLSYCIDIAVRSIKLGFLQMIAPIAIVSYIDPKETISNGKLSNWIKECVTTYFSLFLRLAVVFLAMVLISAIASGILAEGGYISKQVNGSDMNIWIYLFLIIGVFTFAKKVPEMIESIFGIKMSGQLNLNPFKNNGMAALAGGVVGAGIGSVAGGVGALAASRDNGLGARKTIGNVASGFLSGGVKSGISGINNKGKGTFKDAFGAAGRASRAVDLKGTTSIFDRAGGRARNAFGMQSKFESMEGKAKTYDSIAQHIGAIEDRAKDQLRKKDDNWKVMEAQREQIEKKYKDGEYDGKEDIYLLKKQQLQDYEDELVKDYIDHGILHQGGNINYIKDDVIAAERQMLERENRENQTGYNVENWSGMDATKKQAEKAARDVRRTDEYENAKKTDEYVKSAVSQSHMNH